LKLQNVAADDSVEWLVEGQLGGVTFDEAHVPK
jgi:hypothetical protein